MRLRLCVYCLFLLATGFLGMLVSVHNTAWGATTNWSGDITENTEWSAADIHRIVGDLRVVEGVTLTIQPGTMVQFNWQLGLTVEGALNAIGTAEQPILFTSDQDDTGPDGILGTGDDVDTNGNGPSSASKGVWRQIVFTNSDVESVMEHVEIRYAGGWQQFPTVHVNGGRLALINARIVESNGMGLRIEAADPTLTDCTFSGISQAAISMDLASNPMINEVTFENNGFNGLWLDAGELVGDGVWDDGEVVYQMNGIVTVPEGQTLTITAGQVVKARTASADSLVVNGTLVVSGTPAQPIIFTDLRDDTAGGDSNKDGPSTPTAGSWRGIILNNTSTGNILDYIEIRYTGRDYYPALHANGSELTLTNSIIRDGIKTGLRMDNSDPTVSGCTFKDNGGPAMSMDLASNPSVSAVTFENNSFNGLSLDTGELVGDSAWDDADVVYQLTGVVTVPEAQALTISAGQVIKARSYTSDRLIVNGTLVVNGTPEQPVIFTDMRDDTAGGDSNNDGSASTPIASWRGLTFNDTSTGNTLDHVEVRYAGRDKYPAILADGAPVTVSNSVLRDSEASGIIARNSATVEVTNCLITFNRESGIHAETAAVVTAINNTIDGDNVNAFDTGVWVDVATVTLINNLITNNRMAGIRGLNTSTIIASFNDVYNPDAFQGNYAGITDQTGVDGNISADPKYFNRTNRQYQLRAGSPAIDSATSLDAPTTDFDGNPRFDDPNVLNTGGGFEDFVDRGAIERQEVSFSNVDLLSRSVTGPTVGVPDQVATINWTVQNIGSGTASGTWYDAIYLSEDPTWSPDDLFLGDVQHAGDLGPGQSYDGTADVTLGGVLPGNHYFIVRTSARNEVFEGIALENNAAASNEAIEFTITELIPGSPESDQFTEAGQSHYYQISLAAGDTLVVSVDSAASTGANELYIRRGAIPSQSQFDHKHKGDLEPDQELVVPTTQPGTYYVLVHTRSGGASVSSYTITAQLVGFDIRGVSPDAGANSGQVTITIEGAKLTPDTEAALISPDSIVIPAADVHFGDASQLHATFDLTGLAEGLYDVQISEDSQEATAEDAFSVTTGTPGAIRVWLTVPEFVRPGREAQLAVEYVNEGDTDVTAPLMVLHAENANLRWPDSDIFIGPAVQILGISNSGPAGILPPGAGGRVDLVFLPTINTGPVNFDLNTSIDPTADIDWWDMKDDWNLSAANEEVWGPVWGNFTESVGDTLGSYEAVLAENATYLSELGIYTSNAGRLLAFEIAQAADQFGGSTPTGTVDVAAEAPGISLTFGRIFMQSLLGRYELVALGRGWVHSWEVAAVPDEDGNITILSGTSQRLFSLHPSGYFVGVPGDNGTLQREGNTCRLREPDGTVLTFRDDTKLDYMEDPNGNRVTALYVGDLLTGLQHSNGETITISYNAQDRIDQVTAPGGQTVTYAYDASGEHLTSVTGPDGTVQYTYTTGMGAAREHALASITAVDGTKVFFDYDDQGRLIRQRLEGDVETITYSYDGVAGTSVTDASGNLSTTLLDDAGLVGQLSDWLGGVSRMERDHQRNVIRIEAPDGSGASFRYDNFGNLATYTDPLGRRNDMTYNSTFGGLASLRDGRGNTTHNRYDKNGNLRSIIHPDGISEQFEYDALGNAAESVNRRGQKIRFTYDNFGRVTRKDYPDGSHTEFEYDDHGNLTEAANGQGAINLTYDDADRLTRIAYPSGRSLDYTYDTAGRRIQMVDQDGFTVKYAYDETGRLAGLKEGNNASIVSYTYDAVGRLSRQDMGNGTYTTFEYNGAGQLLHLVNFDSDDAVLSRFDYTYDDLGRVTTMDTLDGLHTYDHDELGQLTSVALPGGRIIQYSYDAVGNRVSVTDNGMVVDYTTNSLNQYTSVGDANYTYDADGNLISKTEGTQIWTYTYDSENRLTSVACPEGNWAYEYDALGQLATTTVNGQVTKYLTDPFDLGDIVSEYGTSGSVKARYTHGLGLVSRVDPSSVSAYYGFDGNGSTAHLTGPGGSALNTYAYLPYGELLHTSESVVNPFQYVGQFGVMTGANGLHFMRARFYDGSDGRFVQQDPLGLFAGVNLYSYVENAPNAMVDPSGLTGLIYAPGGMGYWTRSELAELAMYYLRTIPKGSPNPFWGIELKWFPQLVEYRYGRDPRTVLKNYRKFYSEPVKHIVKELSKNPRFLRPRFASFKILPVEPPSVMARLAPALRTAGTLGAYYVSWKGGYLFGTALNEYFGISEKMQNFEVFGVKPIAGITDGIYAVVTAPGKVWEFLKNIRSVSSVVTSFDPNDIVGPAGFGDERWVDPEAVMPYTIRFENASDAAVAAQEVFLTNQLDPDMDWSTFELGNIGFGSTVIQVPHGLQEFETSVEVTGEDGTLLWVNITGSLDLETGVVTWVFRTIDPATGQLPADAFSGFLPPNDETHRGEGFVSYYIYPSENLPTGASIENSASIVFDVNEPINTNVFVNTIDATLPTSSVSALPAISPPLFQVQWSGNDGSSSGIASYDIFVQDNGGAFTPWLTDTTQTSAMFTGTLGHTYGFYSLAKDHVGYEEGGKTSPEATTQVAETMEKGDINGDGVTDLGDAIIALQVECDMDSSGVHPDYFSSDADVMSDERITAEEAIYILQVVSGLRAP